MLVVFFGALIAEYLRHKRVERHGHAVLAAFLHLLCHLVGQRGNGELTEGGAEDALHLSNGCTLHAARGHGGGLETQFAHGAEDSRHATVGGQQSAQVFGLFGWVSHMEDAAAELLNETQVLLVGGQTG